MNNRNTHDGHVLSVSVSFFQVKEAKECFKVRGLAPLRMRR